MNVTLAVIVGSILLAETAVVVALLKALAARNERNNDRAY